MAWVKASQGLMDLFAESLPDDPRVERRKMFGYPSIFVGGKAAALTSSQAPLALSPPSTVTMTPVV